MKKIIVILAIVSIVSISTVAFASGLFAPIEAVVHGVGARPGGEGALCAWLVGGEGGRWGGVVGHLKAIDGEV